MSDTVIQVEGLSKRYRLGRSGTRADLRETVSHWLGRLSPGHWRKQGEVHGNRRADGVNDKAADDDEKVFWALRDVSFSVPRGQVLGIIGRNGAGKSTLLKILSRITSPTLGRIVIDGRVGSLLEVGTGFHPELTGRENIFLNGAVLGMTQREVKRKFEAIVDFAGVDKFLDTPVKRYSSGMYVRLAFAVAAHLEPEVLIVDEVLAVGDAAFQSRCLGRMREVAGNGRTVLFVSHNMAAVQSLCNSAILLESGRLAEVGAPEKIVTQYLRQLRQQAQLSLTERRDRQGDGSLRFTGVDLHCEDGAAPASGRDLLVRVHYQSDQPLLRQVNVSLGVYSAWGQCLMVLGNEMSGRVFDQLMGNGSVVCRIPRLPLAPGVYTINLHAQVSGMVADWVQHACELEIAAGDFYGTGRMPNGSHGVLLTPHDWSIAA